MILYKNTMFGTDVAPPPKKKKLDPSQTNSYNKLPNVSLRNPEINRYL